jgi:hypothetical protein
MGQEIAGHARLDPILAAVATGGVPALADRDRELTGYLRHLASIDPDGLRPEEAKAFWINLYNAGALDLARRTWGAGLPTVLRVRGGFTAPFIAVADEPLSLDGIEHGKVRRFEDPRIHAALVCGSASCPTLRSEAYRGKEVGDQLDDQMRAFLSGGAAAADRERGVLQVSRVFRWYGADFVRPERMPSLLPASRRRVRDALRPWMSPDLRHWVDADDPAVEFLPYDWGLGCAVR